MNQKLIDYLDARYSLEEIIRQIYNPPEGEIAVSFVVGPRDAQAFFDVFGQRVSEQEWFDLDITVNPNLGEVEFEIEYAELNEPVEREFTIDNEKPVEDYNLDDVLIRWDETIGDLVYLRNALDGYINRNQND